MIRARVTGSSWATLADPAYAGRVVRVVVPWDEKEVGPPFLAVDTVGSRLGDVVLVTRDGNTAREVAEAPGAPIHSVILAIVDSSG